MTFFRLSVASVSLWFKIVFSEFQTVVQTDAHEAQFHSTLSCLCFIRVYPRNPRCFSLIFSKLTIDRDMSHSSSDQRLPLPLVAVGPRFPGWGSWEWVGADLEADLAHWYRTRVF